MLIANVLARACDLIDFADAWAIRSEIARAVPAYEGIQNLRRMGDQVQWGGPRLCEGPGPDGNSVPRFGTEDGLARFSTVHSDEFRRQHDNSKFRLSTRRGKQFNSMGIERSTAHRARGKMSDERVGRETPGAG